MQCPIMSSLESLIGGNSSLGETFVPSIKPGYMSALGIFGNVRMLQDVHDDG